MKPNSSKDICFDEIPDALAAIRNGECVVVVDDERRENEGDFIISAEKASVQDINFMIKEGRGLICVAITNEYAIKLDLSPIRNETPINRINGK